jgi:hypothetical protein
MRTRTKKLLLVAATFFCVFVGLSGTWLWYLNNYVHQHCIKLTSIAFRLYADDHNGQLPFSTNGFGGALLLLVKSGHLTDDPLMAIRYVCGPGDDGHVFKEVLQNNSVVPEDQCTRVYIQGLSESNDPQICILFDRNSCRGGDHFRSPWGHRVWELCLLDGSMQIIRDENWPEFSRKQVELLVMAGFSRTNALHFYPAAAP